MLRSGSTWSFNVALRLLRVNAAGRKCFGVYSEDPAVFRAAARRRSSHLVIKAHVLQPAVQDLCRQRFFKAICTWRNPYDVVVSTMNMFGASAESAINSLRIGCRLLSFHQTTNTACVLPYDLIRTAPLEAISRVADYLDMQCDSESLREIGEAVSFRQVQRFSEHVSELPEARLIHQYGQTYDRQTLLHQNHIRDGGTGYGLRTLPPATISEIDAMLREEGFGHLCESSQAPRLGSEEPNVLCS